MIRDSALGTSSDAPMPLQDPAGESSATRRRATSDKAMPE